jgi:hypothetical protein
MAFLQVGIVHFGVLILNFLVLVANSSLLEKLQGLPYQIMNSPLL